MPIELICPECETRTEIEDTLSGLGSYCSNCSRKRKSTALVFASAYEAEKRHEELRKRIYCRDCGYIGLIAEFPFDAPPCDQNRERRCHRCHSDNLINMAEVTMCEHCDEVPARGRGDTWCEHCATTYNEMCRDASDSRND